MDSVNRLVLVPKAEKADTKFTFLDTLQIITLEAYKKCIAKILSPSKTVHSTFLMAK